MANKWYDISEDQVADSLSVDRSVGLGSEQVNERIEKYGFNELREKATESLFQKVLNQLKDFLVIILIGASVVSALIGEVTDALVIIAIVIVNSILGVVQEGKAEKALEALKKMSAPNAKVMRNGKLEIIPARTIVPGDIILLEAGDIVPSDVRLFECSNLRIDEASLTGESVPVEKDTNVKLEGDVSLGDRLNMAYMSTIVTYGRAKGIVVGTSAETEIGKIADKIQDFDDEQTPLQIKLAQLGKWLGLVCLAVCLVVFIVGLAETKEIHDFYIGMNSFGDFFTALLNTIKSPALIEMFMVSVSLAVAAIPEGLPAVVTIVLALGMKKMVARNAIVRKLLAVETLGCVDVICSDKTGTLTQNEMTVKRIYVGGNEFRVAGLGYVPVGEFHDVDGKVIELSNNKDLEILFSSSALCNDSSIEQKAEGQWGIIGDPTEAAMTVVSAKAGYHKAPLNTTHPRLAEIPFDSDRKMMTTFHANFDGSLVSFTKGAPDVIVERCTKALRNHQIVDMTDEIRSEIAAVNHDFAFSALRVLSLAYRRYDEFPGVIKSDNIENDMIFVGLMGMIDPARAEAKDAIKICQSAGIKAVMITGDHRDTAVAIAKDLMMMKDGDGVMTGKELDNLTDDEMSKVVENTSVYARVSPDHKVRIVEALRKNGHIASMTGDGVNDAMALKKADIGVAMGITGTDVAKGTADIVLTDDNFASIVSAVEEGRIIYSNIRKFVFFLLSCNVGEILIVFLSILAGLPVPLVPIQLLWLNLVTDSFPALALGTEKGDPDIMSTKPRKAKEPILNRSMISGIAVQSIALVIAVLGAYLFALHKYPDFATDPAHLSYARTYAFVTLIFAELLRAFSCRSENFTLFKIGFFTNKTLVWAFLLSFSLMAAVIYVPFLGKIFETVPLDVIDWLRIVGFCFIPLLAGEFYKVIRGLFSKK